MMKPTPTSAIPRIPGHADQEGIFPTVYARQLMVSRPLTRMVVKPPTNHWFDLWPLTFPAVFSLAIFGPIHILSNGYHGNRPVTACTLQGMASARSGQAPA